MKTTVITFSGSKYVIDETDDAFTLMADTRNIVTPMSSPVAGVDWPIKRPNPWPPRLGEILRIDCIHVADRGHPRRMPGGGKFTSPVVHVEQVDDEATLSAAIAVDETEFDVCDYADQAYFESVDPLDPDDE